MEILKPVDNKLQTAVGNAAVKKNVTLQCRVCEGWRNLKSGVFLGNDGTKHTLELSKLNSFHVSP